VPEDSAQLRRYYGSRPTDQAALAMHQFELGQKRSANDKNLRKGIFETLDAEIEVQRNRRELGERSHAIEIASGFQRKPHNLGPLYPESAKRTSVCHLFSIG
jgi:hypothetical protein